jgi:hypothetical protein
MKKKAITFNINSCGVFNNSSNDKSCFFTIEIVRFVLGYSSVLFSSKSLIYSIVVVRYSNRRGIVNDDFV